MLIPEMITEAKPIAWTHATNAIKFSYLSVVVWAWSVAFLKTGVAITLLRIRSSPAWNVFLYVMIGIQAVYAVANTAFDLLKCRPMEASWNLLITDAKCINIRSVSIASTISASINIATDILLSIAPARFLITLNRPWLERCMLMFVMGLGLVVSAASLRKTILVQDWGLNTGDTWSQGIAISTLTAIEPLLGSFAACAVCLKTVMSRLLARFGISMDLSSKMSPPSIHVASSGVDGSGSNLSEPGAPLSPLGLNDEKEYTNGRSVCTIVSKGDIP